MFANDPTATLAVHCGNGFDAGFGVTLGETLQSHRRIPVVDLNFVAQLALVLRNQVMQYGAYCSDGDQLDLCRAELREVIAVKSRLKANTSFVACRDASDRFPILSTPIVQDNLQLLDLSAPGMPILCAGMRQCDCLRLLMRKSRWNEASPSILQRCGGRN